MSRLACRDYEVSLFFRAFVRKFLSTEELLTVVFDDENEPVDSLWTHQRSLVFSNGRCSREKDEMFAQHTKKVGEGSVFVKINVRIRKIDYICS